MQLHETPLPANASAFMTSEQLSGRCGMSMLDMGELVNYSALGPVKNETAQVDIPSPERWIFSTQCFKPLRAPCKLRSDFDLDIFTVAILLSGLQRIDELEQTIQGMQFRTYSTAKVGTDPVAQMQTDQRSITEYYYDTKNSYSFAF